MYTSSFMNIHDIFKMFTGANGLIWNKFYVQVTLVYETKMVCDPRWLETILLSQNRWCFRTDILMRIFEIFPKMLYTMTPTPNLICLHKRLGYQFIIYHHEASRRKKEISYKSLRCEIKVIQLNCTIRAQNTVLWKQWYNDLI